VAHFMLVFKVTPELVPTLQDRLMSMSGRVLWFSPL